MFRVKARTKGWGSAEYRHEIPLKKRVQVPVLLKAVLVQGGIFQEKKEAEGTLKISDTRVSCDDDSDSSLSDISGIGTNRDDALESYLFL